MCLHSMPLRALLALELQLHAEALCEAVEQVNPVTPPCPVLSPAHSQPSSTLKGCEEKHSNTTAHHPVVKLPAAASTAV